VIIRQPSPSLTLGGGVVVDPLPRRRHRRFRPELIQRLETLLAGTPDELLVAELDRRGPLAAQTLISDSGLPSGVAAEAVVRLLNENEIFVLSDTTEQDPVGQLGDLTKAKTLLSSRGGWENLLSRIKSVLSSYHQRYPLRLGMPRSELKSRLKLETRLLNEAVQRGQAEGVLVSSETNVRLADHKVTYTAQQQATVDRLLAQFRREPYNTPLPKDVSAVLGEEVMLALIEGNQLTRLSNDVIILTDTYVEFVDWLRKYIAENQAVTVAEVRDVFKTSRKYALALLEYTDEQRITKRVGDQRVLR
jgi:selenocysteine-specific elongation factor